MLKPLGMLSGKSSRSSSMTSLHNLPLGSDIPPPIRRTREEENGQEKYENGARNFEKEEDFNPTHYQFMQQHFLGNIILKLVRDNTELAKKSNLKEMECYISEICTGFFKAMKLEDNKLQDKLAQSKTELENSLIQRDLNSHSINQEVAPPANFSPVPTLTSPARLAESMRLFPCRGSNKFSGHTKDNNMTIIEFLSGIRTAQNQCNLSEQEFKDMLLACTTGRAHLLLLEWINQGESIDAIYHNLALHFDRRLTPEEAKMQLAVYKAPKGQNLARIASHVMMLCNRASTALPPGAARSAYYNLECCHNLIKCLPPQSSQLVQTEYNSLSARLRRAAEITELLRALNVHRHNIDSDIKTNGTSNTIRSQRPPPKQNKSWPQASTYSVAFHTENTEIGNTRHAGTGQGFKNNTFKRGQHVAKNSGQSNYRQNMKPGQRRDNKFSSNHTTPQYCSLCGKKDHTFYKCPNMVSDEGSTVKVFPIQSTCMLCPNFVQPRLSHPSILCPYRKGGPFSKKQ